MPVDYDHLIQSAYAGILAPDGWAPLLEQLRRLANAEQATFMLHDLRLGRTMVSEIANPDAALISDYENQFAPIDPVRPAVADMPLGSCLIDVHDCGRRVVEHGDFHQHFLRAHGLKSVLCAKTCHDGRHLAGLAMQAGVGRDYFSAADVALLQPVLPHLVAATRLRLQVDDLARAAQVGQLLLDGLGWPVLLLDARQRLVYANPAAERWLAGTASGMEAARRLARALARGGSAAPVAAVLADDSGERCCLLGFRLPPRHPLRGAAGAPLSLLVARGPGPTPAAARSLFATLFGLTPAELRLVIALQAHDHLTGAAAALGITHGTARAHLKAAFSKCGCRSQAGLRSLWAEVTGGYVDLGPDP